MGEPLGRRGVAVSTRDLVWCAAMAMAACWTQSALALDPRYPDWPCQQLKVPGIAVASVWNGPSIESIDTTKASDPKQSELVARLAARRTPIEEARKLIADYVTGTSAEKQEKATALFASLYSTLNAQRDEVMSGIERFSRKQKTAAEDIREEARKLREIQDKPDADPAQNEELASRLAWRTRIFEDRRKSTSYVCDVPVLIEKRLFELGAAIQNALNNDAAGK
jgi:DNA repair ATPase RecN